MALNQVINTRVTNYEDLGELLNVASLSLSNAASLSAHPIRKNEFDIEVNRLDAAIASVHDVVHTYVDTTSASLNQALAAATFADSKWTFGGSTELHLGDVLFLDAATQQDSDRAWLMIAANGTANDFKAFGSDVDAAISTAVNSAVSALRGDATTYLDLGLVEDKIQTMDTGIAGRSVTREYVVAWGAPVDGISTSTTNISADFGTKSVSVRVLKDIGGGYFEHISTSTLEISSSASEVRLRTDSSSILSSTLVIEVTGVPVI